jgi:signal transduction histidine kinase
VLTASGYRTAALMLGVGVCVGLSVWGAVSSEPEFWVLDLACAVGAVATAGFARTRPLGATVAASLLAALSPAATPAAAVGIVFSGIRHRFAAAAAVTALAAVAHLVRGAWRPMDGLPYGWWMVLVAVGAAANLAWGALGRSHAALLSSLSERARRAEEEQARRVAEARAAERSALAREMHDVLAHRLSLLATYAGALEYRPDAPPERQARAAGVIRQGVHDALEELRDVVAVLRYDEDDFEAALPVLADVPALVEETRAAGGQVTLEDGLPGGECPPAIGRTVYRVVQEGLTNARKHAAGHPVLVSLAGAPGDRLTVRVHNSVPSREPISEPAPGGHGLVGLTERVRLVGGELDQRRSVDSFEIEARLPWPQ